MCVCMYVHVCACASISNSPCQDHEVGEGLAAARTDVLPVVVLAEALELLLVEGLCVVCRGVCVCVCVFVGKLDEEKICAERQIGIGRDSKARQAVG